MTAITNPIHSKSVVNYSDEQINAKYLVLLPLITKTASIVFSKCKAAAREEAVQNTEAWAFVFLRQLAAKGRLEEAKATPLAWFGIKYHREGRIVGSSCSTVDVLSERWQYLGRAQVVTEGSAGEGILDAFISDSTIVDAWCSVDRMVQFKLDFFEGWFRQQTPRDREIIRDLAMGETTGDVAKKYKVSAGLISQYRKRYAESWNAFINPPEKTDLIDELKELTNEPA
jgi:hypothetical protein